MASGNVRQSVCVVGVWLFDCGLILCDNTHCFSFYFESKFDMSVRYLCKGSLIRMFGCFADCH